MRLTTLEIKGFKSFGDKVTIHFDKGVTAIVGPNGSGKSNVVDAMRWVLGEQKTRMLRSEKMENIIFNGTKNRKPANLAEVSLSFENTKNILPTEYSKVTITRKLYRSGESEYLLNGIPCRLKDITDLFLDTGIGSDSYSIIELKMIDEIINDKNNTIKTLFEEAAGISKYKVRKKQTLQKLEETDGDLSRVNDLLFEIEKNLRTLESQAKKTERYYKIREQYKELSTQLASISIVTYRKSFDQLQSQEEKLHDEKIHLETQIDSLEAELQKQKLDNVDNEKHLAASQKALNEKLQEIRQTENDKKIKNERLKFLQDKESTLTTQLFNDKKYVDELHDGMKQLESDKEKEQQTIELLEKALKELRSLTESTKQKQTVIQTEISGLSKEYSAVQEESHRLEKTFAIQQTQKDSLVKEIERVKTENESRSGELTNIEQQIELLSTQKEGKENSLETDSDAEFEVQQKLKAGEESAKNFSEELISLNRKIDAKQNEFNLTKSLVDNLEGFPESIKFLKKKATIIKDAPLVSDVITCKQEYKIAIENFLEPYMNYFVVENISEAHQSINLLNEAKQGRANFFLLDSIPDEKIKPVSIPNTISALDVIEFEDKYKGLCAKLLKDVLIVIEGQEETPEIKEAEKIFISQNGKFIKSHIHLGGGSVGLFEGKRIGRAKNLEILEKEIKEADNQRSTLKEKIEKLSIDIAKIKQDASALSQRKNITVTELNRIDTTLATLQSRKEQFSTFQNKNLERITEIESQLSMLEEAGNSGSFSDTLAELNYKKSEVQQKLISIQNEAKEFDKLYNEQSQKYNQENIYFLQQQNKLSTINRDLIYKKGQAENLTRSITQNSTELEKVKIQVFEIFENSNDSDENIIAMYEEKESLEKAVNETEALYTKARVGIDETENKIRELRKRKENTDAQSQALKDKVTDIKIQLNSLRERLSVEFSVDIENIKEQESVGELDETDLRDKVEKIKLQISNYGPINPMAIEAFNEISERHTFIVSQKDDLLKAKESLLQTIHEIDTTAKEKFMAAFVMIRENFIKVFRSLFSEEDNCDLVLADPKNPLESDINITAQPKGKRPLSINQLSGGEKTLTATALLFSIYLLKPAPFCIFDEVDAPLDDNNIDKFNKIIKKFSVESQFIIITHNKRTMASTDIIYGVTMIELGVTQVVPVDMREVA